MFECLLMIYAAVSLIALVLYGSDKRRAIRKRRRIREATLLSLALLGGAVGALLGMTLFRHKTRHWYFWGVSLLGLALQAALAVWVYRLG